MKKSILILAAVGASILFAAAQERKTDYITSVKLKALENREAKLNERLDSLKSVPIIGTDAAELEQKLKVRDSMMLSVRSEIVTVQLERAEIEAKKGK